MLDQDQANILYSVRIVRLPTTKVQYSEIGVDLNYGFWLWCPAKFRFLNQKRKQIFKILSARSFTRK